MPYELDGDCVKKKDTGETVKCHDSHDKAMAHLQALQANVKDSAVAEMSMRITKAAYNKSEKTPMKWAAIDSDTDEDLYTERMSLELYQDFEYRIKNNIPVPDAFKDAICEDAWCGGMPYLSIAHFKSGSEKRNVPGDVDAVFTDGTRLKSKGVLHDSPLGRKVFDALREDLYMEKSGNSDHMPVRISIGFLDLEHKHLSQAGGQEFTFTRTDTGQICPLCAQGIGGKIYMKGHLVHLAMTRVPVNPRTQMSVEKSMEDITSKRKDAESIVGELADGLEEKSISSDVLVVRADEDGSEPVSDIGDLQPCYDPNTDSFDQACVDSVMEKYVGRFRRDATVKSTVSKSLLDAVRASLNTLYKSNGYAPVVEEAMATKDKAEEKALGIPEKKFEYEGISGDGNNNLPNPVKAETMDEEEGEQEESTSKSTLDSAYEKLKSTLANARSVEDVQKAFNALGVEVEKSYTPPAPSANDIAEIVKSAVAQAVEPLALQLATLKAQMGGRVEQGSGNVVKSKALTLSGYTRPEDMIQRSAPLARKLTQIEKLAYKSTGAQVE